MKIEWLKNLKYSSNYDDREFYRAYIYECMEICRYILERDIDEDLKDKIKNNLFNLKKQYEN